MEVADQQYICETEPTATISKVRHYQIRQTHQ